MAEAAVRTDVRPPPRIYRDDLAYEVGAELGHKCSIGMIVLAPDSTMEHECRRIIPTDGVTIYATRIFFPNDVTRETLAAMEGDIVECTKLIHPDRKLDVLAFGCSSGTIVIGEQKVFDLMRSVRPGIACTSPMTAGVAGFKALGCKRIAMVTPYTRDINDLMRNFVESKGIEVPVVGTFNLPYDDQVARISPSSVRDAVLELGREDVDGVFVSCSSIYVSPVVEECEAALDKPVMSSDTALAWHAMRLGGYGDRIDGFGRLFHN
jgi:maleate isomerase